MSSTAPDELANLVQQLDQALPQTQCARCGYPDCRSYAAAVASGEAEINQCPPGGDEGVRRLAALTGKAILALNPENGIEAARALAVIDESWCIGCTLCIRACPVDCIVGAPKQMHVIVNEQCTGCELCIPACPVDCISMVEVSGGRTAWEAWSKPQADEARQRYQFHQMRVARAEVENEERLRQKAKAKLADIAAASKLTDPKALDAKRAIIEAALARARARAK